MKLFKGTHSKSCSLCEHATVRQTEKGPVLFCSGSEVEPQNYCFRYQYDPLKRIPPVSAQMKKNFSKEDFTL